MSVPVSKKRNGQQCRQNATARTESRAPAFYELLWHTAGLQGDIAKLHAEDIDKIDRVISFQHRKTRWRKLQPASFKYGRAVEALL